MSNIKKFKNSGRLISRPLLAGAVAMTALPALNVDAASSIFLKITNIPGESIDEKHKGQIDVLDFSAGFAGASSQNGTLRLSKPACGPVDIKKRLDAASGPLVDALMKATVLPDAVFEFTTPGAKDSSAYYIVTLTNVNVTSINQNSGDERPEETVQFLPRGVQLVYKMQNTDGNLVAMPTVTVDCSK